MNIPLRPDGYPLLIPFSDGVNPPQKEKTLLMWDLLGATPTGQFRLKSSGSGQIRLINGASGTFSSPVDTLVQVNSGVILEIRSSQAGDPVRDIQFILPAYVNTYQDQTFTHELTGFLEDFQVIRFMDFTQTNGSPIQNWAQRTPQAYYTQAKFGGVAWEYVVQLANQTQKDVWINIPHQANNAYIDSLAHLLQNSLNTSLKVYLEYSNEVWNGAFSQNAYCAQMGQNLGYSGPSWESSLILKGVAGGFLESIRIHSTPKYLALHFCQCGCLEFLLHAKRYIFFQYIDIILIKIKKLYLFLNLLNCYKKI